MERIMNTTGKNQVDFLPSLPPSVPHLPPGRKTHPLQSHAIAWEGLASFLLLSFHLPFFLLLLPFLLILLLFLLLLFAFQPLSPPLHCHHL